jgi:hypothetical protein
MEAFTIENNITGSPRKRGIQGLRLTLRHGNTIVLGTEHLSK